MKRKIVIAAVTAAVLAGGTAATAVAFADDNDSEVRSSVASGHAAKVDVKEAVAAALKAVPGTATEAELDDEDGGLVWEVDVYGSDKARHDVTVDAGNGKVLGKHTDEDKADDDRDHGPKASGPARVSLDAAVDTALKARPGTVTSVDLDHDRDGRAQHWEVEVTAEDGKEHELKVDAADGRVTADRVDDDHQDRKHDDHDDPNGDHHDDRDED
ncbi:PepSY domain-containing protein [Streptomyces sp. NPDC057499]|uniref:PepSY domain-containing protein n=1 Tax=Streptomyces sp. NPDC057499 TaxID=3346150 RepID=UPI00367445C4